jgi:hypothetical protein
MPCIYFIYGECVKGYEWPCEIDGSVCGEYEESVVILKKAFYE